MLCGKICEEHLGVADQKQWGHTSLQVGSDVSGTLVQLIDISAAAETTVAEWVSFEAYLGGTTEVFDLRPNRDDRSFFIL